ncbi:unnamed protein product, partial [Prorocentrum cordatum]
RSGHSGGRAGTEGGGAARWRPSGAAARVLDERPLRLPAAERREDRGDEEERGAGGGGRGPSVAAHRAEDVARAGVGTRAPPPGHPRDAVGQADASAAAVPEGVHLRRHGARGDACADGGGDEQRGGAGRRGRPQGEHRPLRDAGALGLVAAAADGVLGPARRVERMGVEGHASRGRRRQGARGGRRGPALGDSRGRGAPAEARRLRPGRLLLAPRDVHDDGGRAVRGHRLDGPARAQLVRRGGADAPRRPGRLGRPVGRRGW